MRNNKLIIVISMKYFLFISILILSITNASSQKIIPLYADSIPNSKPTKNNEWEEKNKDGILIVFKVSFPTLSIYLPAKEKATGEAVIICPGGGYSILAAGHEGTDVAIRFNESGIAAMVLKYRIPDDSTMINKEVGPLQDAQRAIQLVRDSAAKWNIKKNKIGIMGFSAGGHLASTAATHFNKDYISNKNKTSLRPDFAVLVYPVISFNDSVGHSGSKENLLGKNASIEKVKEYSNELQVTKNTPPAFLVHAKNDPVKVENSLLFAAALKKNKVPYKIYLYEKGGHGYGMNNPTSTIKWMDLVIEWIYKLK